MAQFNYIQSFIIRKNTVNSAPQVLLTSVDLYFKNKPDEQNNDSGIEAPGVGVYICPFVGENPNPDEKLQEIITSVEYNEIVDVADASQPTTFNFETPIVLDTDTYYGIVIVFDDNSYELFTAVQNEILLNTTQKYSGTSGEGDGKLYIEGDDDTLQPVSSTDLKFEARIARFTSNSVSAVITNDNYEFFTCNNMSTAIEFQGGEFVFTNFGKVANSTVNTFFSRAGTVRATIGNNIIIGTNTVFDNDYTEGDYLVITNTSNTDQQDIVTIETIVSNTEMTLDKPVRFSNTFWHNKVMTGELIKTDYVNKKLTLKDSTASNSSIRFHSNSVNYFTISNPGGSYANTDTVTVSNGTVNATAVLVTNATGNVVALRLITAGGGFPNASHSVVTITTSTGSSASLAPVIQTPLKGEISGATANLVTIDDITVETIDPMINVFTTSTTTVNVEYAIANSSGYVPAFTATDLTAPIQLPYPGKIFSRSNELKTSTNLYDNNKSAAMRVTVGVNNISTNNTPTFFAPYFYDFDLDVFTFTNRINSTSANTDSEVGRGTLLSKHISNKISLANNAFAEDIRVFINAYRPANTQILLYAKIHNSQDSEPYDDKSWSPLQVITGQNQLSATGNREDVKEYQYGFKPYPDVQFTCNTTATTKISNNVVLTTTNLTSNLAVNDLVRIYNPVFSTTNYLVTAVDSVNSTAVILQDAISNNGLVGNSLKIDKLKFKNVAYNNVLNDNVVRYFTTSMSPVDGFDSVSVKMVFLADKTSDVPEVDDIRVIAVSS
jgi:hypothetical protein